MNEKLEEIKRLFAEKLGVSTVNESKSLKDLGLDSLDVVEYCLDLEDRYGIQFETEELDPSKTVGDLFALIASKLGE